MPKIHVYCDERYPDYGFDENPDPEYDDIIEISEEELTALKAADKAYEEYQTKLKELYKRQE